MLPLCDKHWKPMYNAQVVFVTPDPDAVCSGGTTEMMTCPLHPECTRHYSKRCGYVDIRNHRLDENTVVRVACKKEGHGALAVVAIDHDEPVWQCLEDDCHKGISGVEGQEGYPQAESS
jgi:hypothetical protein